LIPYAGGRKSGKGVSNKSAKKAVAVIRNFDHQGLSSRDATEEVASRILKYVEKH